MNEMRKIMETVNLKEAAVVKANQIPPEIMKGIDQVSRMFGAPVQFHSGIHGIIVTYNADEHGNRLMMDDLRELVTIDLIRWLDISDTHISVGIEGYAK